MDLMEGLLCPYVKIVLWIINYFGDWKGFEGYQHVQKIKLDF